MHGKKYSSVIFCFLIVISFAFQGCKTAYLHPNFAEMKSKHKKIAILPFQVVLDKAPKNFTMEMVKDLEKKEGDALQMFMYSKFLQRQIKNEYTVTFQDVDQTNTILTKKNITLETIKGLTKKELCKELDVDVVFSGVIRRSKPMSEGSALALGILFGAWGSTNKVAFNVNIHEAEENILLWNYENQASGSVGSTPDYLSGQIMKGISYNFPYKVEKPKVKKQP